jgi:hypothetical protein
MLARSRGRFCPSIAFVLPPNGSQRAQGRPGAGGTRWSVRDKSAHGVDRWGGRSPGLPCADGFNGVLRALPGERCTIAPVAPPMADARARSGRHITAGLDAQTPGVRTTRLLRPRTVPPKSSRARVCSPPMTDKPALQRRVVPRRVRTHSCPPCRHAARADAAASTATRPAYRDDRERPFGRARMRGVCHKSEIRKSEIFLRGGIDGVFCPTPRSRPRAARGLGASPQLHRHCEHSEAIQSRICGKILDCFAALAMTEFPVSVGNNVARSTDGASNPCCRTVTPASARHTPDSRYSPSPRRHRTSHGYTA